MIESLIVAQLSVAECSYPNDNPTKRCEVTTAAGTSITSSPPMPACDPGWTIVAVPDGTASFHWACAREIKYPDRK